MYIYPYHFTAVFNLSSFVHPSDMIPVVARGPSFHLSSPFLICISSFLESRGPFHAVLDDGCPNPRPISAEFSLYDDLRR